MAKIHMQWLKKKAEAAAKRTGRSVPVVRDDIDQLCAVQKVEIIKNDQGGCITTYAPTNEQIASCAANAARPPKFITRYVFFNFGVPPIYDWTNPNHIQRNESTVGVQQFTYSGWLKQIEAERVAGDGHISPYHLDLILEND